ncbi:MAG: hypothetical protein KAS32_24120 [Candidatus Peribacteraceae bacterium]|nr:hypothetical protein [Candidatus Peribacteraceae bacterium]
MNKESQLELIVGEKNGEIFSGDVAVRWCLKPELIQEMDKEGITDPHILLITNYQYDRWTALEHRHLVPLSQMMTYVRFSKAGKSSIHAYVINGGKHKNRRKMKSNLLGKTGGEYDTTLLYDNESQAKISINESRYIGYTQIDLTIPEGVFGKEPGPRLKWFVNHWHSNEKVQDECEFRRRMVLAFTLKWPFVMIEALGYFIVRLLLVILWAVLGAHYDIRYKHLFKNIYDPGYIIINSDEANTGGLKSSNRFIIKVKTEHKYSYGVYDKTYYFLSLLPFTPGPLLLYLSFYSFTLPEYAFPIIAVIVFIFVLFTSIWDLVSLGFMLNDKFDFKFTLWSRFDGWMAKNTYWPTVVLWLSIILLASIFTLLLVSIIMYWEFTLGIIIVASFIGGLTYVLDKLMGNSIEDNNNYVEMQRMLCPKDPENLVVDYKAIPASNKSVKLWYLDTKNKICKPMQL